MALDFVGNQYWASGSTVVTALLGGMDHDWGHPSSFNPASIGPGGMTIAADNIPEGIGALKSALSTQCRFVMEFEIVVAATSNYFQTIIEFIKGTFDNDLQVTIDDNSSSGTTFRIVLQDYSSALITVVFATASTLLGIHTLDVTMTTGNYSLVVDDLPAASGTGDPGVWDTPEIGHGYDYSAPLIVRTFTVYPP